MTSTNPDAHFWVPQFLFSSGILVLYRRHGQSAALQLIFAALGPFLQPEIWSKNVNKSIQRTIKAEIVTLSSLIWNSAARDGK